MSDTTVNQFVSRFADATERTAFVPDPPVVTPSASAPLNGYFAFQQDDGSAWAWDTNLADWVEVGGGGGGGNVNAGGTLTANQLVIGAGSTDVAALGSLGTTTTVLHGNAAGAPTFGAVALATDISGLGTGVATALAINVGSAGAFGAWQFIEEATPSAVGTLTFSSLGTFTNLKIAYSARSSLAASFSEPILMRVNGDTGSNYDIQRLLVNATTVAGAEIIGGTSAQIALISAASADAGNCGSGEILLCDYRGTTFHKGGTSSGMLKQAASTGNMRLASYGWTWRSTSAITSITLLLGSGNYVAGSKFVLYGMR